MKKHVLMGVCYVAAFVFLFYGCATWTEDNKQSVEKSLTETVEKISESVRPNMRIAVLNIADPNQAPGSEKNKTIFQSERSWYILDTLTTKLVDLKKFMIVDRTSLDAIRMEKNFQLSGEVSDDTAISIGKILGAEIVITGTITTAGKQDYIRIKALKVDGGQILCMTYSKI
jgi:curli biogenesis system outer membrane secretion channel CsgG